MSFAASLVLIALVLALPDRFVGAHATAFHLPLELPLIAMALWLIPARRILAALVAAVLVLALATRIANTATFIAFDRPFDATVDFALAPAGMDFLMRSLGTVTTIAVVVGIFVVVGLLGALLYVALRRVAAPPAPIVPSVVAALAVAVLMVLAPVKRGGTVRVLADAGQVIRDGLISGAAFDVGMSEEPLADIPDATLYAALRGRDVQMIFAESYGRVVIDDPRYENYRRQLDAVGTKLGENGFRTRSAWLVSPTFGGASWLAHSTLLSGLKVSDQRRYGTLTRSKRSTMIQDFSRAGWRTVMMMPEIEFAWPEGQYFRADAIHDGPSLKFGGANFAYMSMPDQFTLAGLQTRELAATDRKPVMAMVGLVSGHAPWTPLPRVVPWDKLGKGEIFDTERDGDTPEAVWSNREATYRQYELAMSYVLATLESFILTYARENTVIFIIGDHQPMAHISGEGAVRDVPVHVIARDPAVLAALADWGWTEGMRPDTTSPTWPMETLRTRLARAFSTGP